MLKEIRNNLKQVSVINNININISYKNIEYEMYYYGNLNYYSKFLNYIN